MKLPTQTVQDDNPNGKKYFFITCNMIDDIGLDLAEFRIYGHYQRICGDAGSKPESIRQTAEICRISRSKVKTTRKSLAQKGLITIETGDHSEGKPDIIMMNDIWATNVALYAEKKAQKTGSASGLRPNPGQTVPPDHPAAPGQDVTAPGYLMTAPRLSDGHPPVTLYPLLKNHDNNDHKNDKEKTNKNLNLISDAQDRAALVADDPADSRSSDQEGARAIGPGGDRSQPASSANQAPGSSAPPPEAPGQIDCAVTGPAVTDGPVAPELLKLKIGFCAPGLPLATGGPAGPRKKQRAPAEPKLPKPPKESLAQRQTKPPEPRDDRVDNTGLQRVREILGRYPNKLVWGRIIQTVGDDPDLQLIDECAGWWAAISQNMFNLERWLFEEYPRRLEQKLHPTPKPAGVAEQSPPRPRYRTNAERNMDACEEANRIVREKLIAKGYIDR